QWNVALRETHLNLHQTSGDSKPYARSCVHWKAMRPQTILWSSVLLLLTAALSLPGFSGTSPQQSAYPALDTVLTAGVQQRMAPGVVAIVVDRERVLYLGTAGQMNVRARKAMRADTIFRIASMTKPITAVAIMMLQ